MAPKWLLEPRTLALSCLLEPSTSSATGKASSPPHTSCFSPCFSFAQQSTSSPSQKIESSSPLPTLSVTGPGDPAWHCHGCSPTLTFISNCTGLCKGLLPSTLPSQELTSQQPGSQQNVSLKMTPPWTYVSSSPLHQGPRAASSRSSRALPLTS